MSSQYSRENLESMLEFLVSPDQVNYEIYKSYPKTNEDKEVLFELFLDWASRLRAISIEGHRHECAISRAFFENDLIFIYIKFEYSYIIGASYSVDITLSVENTGFYYRSIDIFVEDLDGEEFETEINKLKQIFMKL